MKTLEHFAYVRVIVLTVLIAGAISSQGQSMSKADADFKEFVKQSSTGGNKEQMYNHLYNSYTGYLAVLKKSPRGTSNYQNAKSALRTLHPYLQNGAGYYSEMSNDEKGVLFARAFVDIPLLDEMKGEFFKHDSYYPTIVYYAAAHCYNAGDYEAALKYFNEYLSTGDRSKRSTVEAFMEQAKVLVRSQPDSSVPSVSGYEHPDYEAFAQSYVEEKIKKWQEKDPYETVAEYNRRVNSETQRAKIKELQEMAMNEYVQRYIKDISSADMNLKPYNADLQTFQIETKYGNLVLEVPRTHNEARRFEEGWSGMQLINPKFKYVDGKVTLASLTFCTPSGKKYQYSDNKALAYEEPIDINLPPVVMASSSGKTKSTPVKQSDVDTNIPKVKGSNPNTFAVIIANENYENVGSVPMAKNDGEVFAKYCEQTLCLPNNNIRKYTNATYGVINRAVRDICDIAKAYDGDISIIFYYAGHGIPNERTRDAYLMPVDALGSNPEDDCYAVSSLYNNLGATKATSIVVFLDACFSGTMESGQSLLASARGVAIKAKKDNPIGNMVVFSAATGDQTAFPLREQGHGMFTYFLLKKLQETKGKATLKELGDYIISNVKQQSIVINKKLQEPTVSASRESGDSWEKQTLKP